MDCLECCAHVRKALTALPGVQEVTVLLAAEKALLTLDPAQVDLGMLQQAVERAGYRLAEPFPQAVSGTGRTGRLFMVSARSLLTLFGLVFGGVLLLIVAGEWFGLLERVTALLPWYVGAGLVIVAALPIFWNVVRATLQRRVISHTLMSLGVLAALAIGQWTTAAVVIFFMHLGNFIEGFTSERSRQALKRLTALLPRLARVERDGEEVLRPVEEVQVGDYILVRPGEAIPIDGEVVSGQASVNQAALTGESLPIEVTAGSPVLAATLVQAGALRVRTVRAGADTTFARMIALVEEAEAQRAPVQRLADRFPAWFLPVVLAVALLAWLVRRDPLASAAVLVVACSCSVALATPIAMLASIGAAAARGLLIKGGKYVERLAQADVLLLDKTGTITEGILRITDVVPAAGQTRAGLLGLVTTAERYSEHPLAEAVRRAARAEQLDIGDPEDFEALPGLGIRARVNGRAVVVGNGRLLPQGALLPEARTLAAQGKALLFVEQDGEFLGLLAAADTLRPQVREALAALRQLGIRQIELLTGDHEAAAASLAAALGTSYRAQLLPEEKIGIVKSYQKRGHTVIMVGDGVNDAPALAQADIGIAMGVIGTDVALEAAPVVLLREDWMLLPDLLASAQRTMRIVRLNLGFTLLYNLVGLTLAACGLLPPMLAAAAQSLPDLGVLVSSARLLHQPARARLQASGRARTR